MKVDDLKDRIKEIVARANQLKNKIIVENAPVNYACIFCQSQKEYDELLILAQKIGEIVQTTPMGPVFLINPLPTVAGSLKLLKIRKPDLTRPEKGDADFTLSNYQKFKQENIVKTGFKLIKKEKFEMIEYLESGSDVRIYFSYPTLAEVLGIK